MPVKQISKSKFDAYNPPRQGPADNHFSKEVDWYENTDTAGIATITKYKDDVGDYDVVVFKVQGGTCEFQDTELNHSTLSEAQQKVKNIL